MAKMAVASHGPSPNGDEILLVIMLRRSSSLAYARNEKNAPLTIVGAVAPETGSR